MPTVLVGTSVWVDYFRHGKPTLVGLLGQDVVLTHTLVVAEVTRSPHFTTVMPRFYETDAVGHINNTVVNCWFETAREPIFRIFTPEMDIARLSLILARTEVDFAAQIHCGSEVTLNTGIEKLGNTSFVVWHEAWQGGVCVAPGKAVQVAFDFATQKSQPMTEVQRQALAAHLVS